jgi:hypothetical protein
MWKNREFKVGDEVVDSNFGYGKVDVIKTAYLEVLFLSGERQCYFFDGRIGKPCLYPSLFHTDNNPFELAYEWSLLKHAKGLFTPTETPIEELKVGDMVWRKEDFCTLKKMQQSKIKNIDGYVIWFDSGLGVKTSDFFDIYTTIPPQTAPTPNINRAELLEVARIFITGGCSPKEAVELAKALINEVDNECK